MDAEYVVHGAAGSGSVPVEAALMLLGLPYRVVENAPWESREAADRVGQVNRLRQAPAVILPGGELMTDWNRLGFQVAGTVFAGFAACLLYVLFRH